MYKQKPMYLIAGILILILLAIALVIYKFGGIYKGGLEKIINNPQSEEVQLSKKKPIKKITFKNTDNSGCVEVTPDGIVRVYTDCGKNLDQAARLNDPKNILKLIKLVSEKDWDKLRNKGTGKYYEISIETENGTETIYIQIDEPNSGGDEITETIIDIQNDMPTASPVSTMLPNVSDASPSILPSVIPSGIGGFMSPVPSPSEQPAQQPFICPFAEVDGKKKPINVSNIICSADPSPGP